MTRIIGLTGGIGSGKSTAAQVFRLLGIPVFNADDEAKFFYDPSAGNLDLLNDILEDRVVVDGKADLNLISRIVFNDPVKLKKLNALIHPFVRKRFADWVVQMNSPLVIREAAILIESGSYTDCEDIIQVTAPAELRISRVMKRSNLTREAVLSRIENQMSDEERSKYCRYTILNDDRHLIIPQIENILDEIFRS